MFTVIPQFGMVYIKNNVFKNIILPYYIFHVILRYLKFKYKYVMYLYIFYYHILNFLAISRFCLYLKLVVGVFSVRNISLGGLFIGMIVWTHMFCMHMCAHTHTHTNYWFENSTIVPLYGCHNWWLQFWSYSLLKVKFLL